MRREEGALKLLLFQDEIQECTTVIFDHDEQYAGQ